MNGIVATAEIDLDAEPNRVWSALTDPAQIEQYMFGSRVVTDWKAGSPIVWKGQWEGESFDDKGEVVDVQPGSRLVVTHFSPLSGQPDEPTNYHTLEYILQSRGAGTHLSLSQDGNSTAEEAEHSRAGWAAMLDNLKGVVDRS
jgi:uncharacterized protein YndB with AHSA1/START domain